MKILIDVNLSPKWVAVLEEAGRQAIHWYSVGPQNAPDHEILSYAKSKGYVVFTHDLDFGADPVGGTTVSKSLARVRCWLDKAICYLSSRKNLKVENIPSLPSPRPRQNIVLQEEPKGRW